MLVHSELNFLYQFWIHTELVPNLGPLGNIRSFGAQGFAIFGGHIIFCCATLIDKPLHGLTMTFRDKCANGPDPLIQWFLCQKVA